MKASIIGCVALIAVLSASPAAAAAIQAPFAVPTGTPGKMTKAKPCEAPPDAVTVFSADSVYQKGDATHSKIDPEAKERYDEAVGPLRTYSQQLIRMANAYVGSDGRDRGSAQCTISWLANWAKADALGTIETRQAALSTTRVLSAIAFAYIEVKGAPGISPEDKAAIEAWLRRLAVATQEVYGDKGNSNLGNHRYWGGLAVAAVAVAINDPGLLDWAMESYRIGACQVKADGTMPIELSRGPRSRDYHIHALGPLVMLAEIGARNGVDTYGMCNSGLKRAVAFTLKAVADPTEIEALARARQLPLKSMNSRLAWIAVYRSRFPLPVEIDMPDKLNSSTLGGNMELLYPD